MKLADLKDYKLVWSEEFEGTNLNDTKFATNEDVASTKNMAGDITFDYCNDEKFVKVADGKLILNCAYDEKRNCFVGPKPITNKATMRFKYGYLEIRARLPYSHGSLATISALAKGAIGCEKEATYYSNMQITAPGNGQYAHSCIFKEYEDYNEDHPFFVKGRTFVDNSYVAQMWGVATPDSLHSRFTELVMDDFKTYGLLWTPDEVVFTVNGYINTRMSLAKDFLRPSGVEGFRKPHFIQFESFLNVDTEKRRQIDTARVKPEDIVNMCPFEVEYVRLYQKDGEGELNLA